MKKYILIEDLFKFVLRFFGELVKLLEEFGCNFDFFSVNDFIDNGFMWILVLVSDLVGKVFFG